MRLFDILLEFTEVEKIMLFDEYVNLILNTTSEQIYCMIPILKNLRVKKVIIKNNLIKIQLYTE